MADSVGGPVLPRSGIQEGHLHFDKDNNVLYVYSGGNPATGSNWSVVNTGSSSGSSGSSGLQRWSFHITGNDISTGLGVNNGQFYFVAPVAGTFTKWATIVGTNAAPENISMQLYFDPFVAFTLLGSFTIPQGSSNLKTERVISKVMVAGQIILVFVANTLSPAVQAFMIDGFVDFTPS